MESVTVPRMRPETPASVKSMPVAVLPIVTGTAVPVSGSQPARPHGVSL